MVRIGCYVNVQVIAILLSSHYSTSQSLYTLLEITLCGGGGGGFEQFQDYWH